MYTKIVYSHSRTLRRILESENRAAAAFARTTSVMATGIPATRTRIAGLLSAKFAANGASIVGRILNVTGDYAFLYFSQSLLALT